MPDPMSHFGFEAQGILSNSQWLVSAMHSDSLQVEHLLLTILSDSSGSTAAPLIRLKVDLNSLKNNVYRGIEKILPFDKQTTKGKMPINLNIPTSVLNLFTNAENERQRLQHPEITSEHLLLAMAYDKKDKIAQLLSDYGATYEKLSKLIENVPNTDKPFGL